MITRILKFFTKAVLTLMVLAAIAGFLLAKCTGPSGPAVLAAPVATAVPWGIAITVGNPVVSTVVVPPTPPSPPSPPAPPMPPASQTGQVLLTGVLDPCCTPAENWPVVLEIRQGLLYATEFRGENNYEEYLVGAGVGPGVVRIIAASAGWRHQNGYWDPILTVFYEDGNGSNFVELNTRHKFGR